MYSHLLLVPTWNMFSVLTQLDQIMSYAVFLAKKVQLHLSGTTGAKVCSSETLIFHLQRPYSFHLQKPYVFHQFSSSQWSVRLLKTVSLLCSQLEVWGDGYFVVCGENLKEERLCGLKMLTLGLGRNADASCTDPDAKAGKKKPSGWSRWSCRLKYHRKPGRCCRPASKSSRHFCCTGILQTCRTQLKAKVQCFSSLMCPLQHRPLSTHLFPVRVFV